jgi:hypothetical protein
METVASMNYKTVNMACGAEYNYALDSERISESYDVRYDYERRSSGHYFSDGALRFFGSRNFETVAQGVSVELQTKVDGDRYKVTVWVDRDGVPSPSHGCWHATRRQAVKCAKDTGKLLREG